MVTETWSSFAKTNHFEYTSYQILDELWSSPYIQNSKIFGPMEYFTHALVLQKYQLILLRNLITDGSFKEAVKRDDRQRKMEVIKKEEKEIKIKGKSTELSQI